jgi:hypothetical protein
LIPRPGAEDRVGDRLHGLVLAHHPLVQDLVQAQQLVPLPLLQAADRDACPAGDDLRDLLLGEGLTQQPLPALLDGELLLLGGEPPLQLGQLPKPQFGGPVKVVVALGHFGFLAQLFHFFPQRLDPAQRLAFGFPLGAHGVGLGAQVGQVLAEIVQA